MQEEYNLNFEYLNFEYLNTKTHHPKLITKDSGNEYHFFYRLNYRDRFIEKTITFCTDKDNVISPSPVTVVSHDFLHKGSNIAIAKLIIKTEDKEVDPSKKDFWVPMKVYLRSGGSSPNQQVRKQLKGKAKVKFSDATDVGSF